MIEIRFSVPGWPPAKSEALSIFNEDHPHAGRVRTLLKAALDALAGSAWNPSERRPIGLEVTVLEPAEEHVLSDATNLLGGVADVLQAQRANAVLSHLGELADCSLYANDAQICEVEYHVEPGDSLGYLVRVWVVDADN